MAEPVKLYCAVCGHKLKPDMRIVGYDEYNGKAIRPFIENIVCGNDSCKRCPEYRGCM